MAVNSARPRRPTQADIARQAGVSQATVSLVINHVPGQPHAIGEAARARVWAAVEELGYVANPAARRLAGGNNHLLGVYTFEPVFPADHRDFYYPFLLGIEDAAQTHGFDLLLFTSAGADGGRAIYRSGVNRLQAADGCVLLGRGGDLDELRRLSRDRLPVVFVGRRDLGHEFSPVAYVGADYAGATQEVTEHLLGLGHERIAYLGWKDAAEPTVDRLAGYQRAMAAAGVFHAEELICRVADEEVDELLLHDLRQLGATALIAQDEILADRARRQLLEAGVGVPDAMSIALLGEPPRGEPTGVNWTTFAIPRRAMGATALTTLMELVETGDDRRPKQLLPCTFHAGATTGPPA